jgi:pimeloyl-ACP methyl ester carboxylesterase
MGDPAIDHEIDLPGRGRTRVRDVPGPAGAPALLLLHGLGATGRLNWGRCYRPLSEHFRVLSLDHRGHGSGVRTRRFRLEDCADDAVHAAEARGVSHFIAVGYSMGGPIASLTWRRHPERVTGLVLCATSRHFVAPQIAAFARATLPFAAATARLVPGRVHSHMLGRMLRGIEHAGMRERVKEELSGHDPATLVQAVDALTRFSSHDWIGDIAVPTSVVVTTRDELVNPSRQYKLAEAIPGARVFEIDGDHNACVAHPGFAACLVQACRALVS